MRMGTELPKQFIPLLGKPVFIRSIEAFYNAYHDIKVVLVLPGKYIEYAKQLVLEFSLSIENIHFVPGGNTRFESVKNGLKSVPDDHLVFIHDAVRCLVSADLIRRCAETCLKEGSAIPVLPMRDSIREVLSDGSSKPIERSVLRIVQTPQTFIASTIKVAYDKPYHESYTDEATVAEAFGQKVNLEDGEESNIKLTYTADIDFACWKLQQNQS